MPGVKHRPQTPKGLKVDFGLATRGEIVSFSASSARPLVLYP